MSSVFFTQGVRGRSTRGTNVRRLISGSLLAYLPFCIPFSNLHTLRPYEGTFFKEQQSAGKKRKTLRASEQNLEGEI
jgi:hypothetical protein